MKRMLLAGGILVAAILAVTGGALLYSDLHGNAKASSPAVTAAMPGPSPAPANGSSAVTELSTPKLVQQLRPSVVRVESDAATLDVFGEVVPSRGVGTGFIIDEQGHVVTNNHVVVKPETCDEPSSQIKVTLNDGRTFPASIVGRDVPTDLAVLQIDATNLTPAELADSSSLQVGDDVVAIGNALDLPGGPTVTRGVASAEDRQIDEDQCGVSIPGAIQTDAAINPGNSGGPLINVEGDVVGITTAVISGAEGVGFAISSATAGPIIQQLIANGRVDRGFLGVSVVAVTSSLAQQLNLAVDQGVAIRQVQAGGPADSAGLERGDVITQLAGKDMATTGDLFRVLMEHEAGERVDVTYYRQGQAQHGEVTLGSSTQ
jgi:serine protease Do